MNHMQPVAHAIDRANRLGIKAKIKGDRLTFRRGKFSGSTLIDTESRGPEEPVVATHAVVRILAHLDGRPVD